MALVSRHQIRAYKWKTKHPTCTSCTCWLHLLLGPFLLRQLAWQRQLPGNLHVPRQGDRVQKGKGQPRQTRPACAKSGGVKPPTGPSCRCEHRPGAACLITPGPRRAKKRVCMPLDASPCRAPSPASRTPASACVFLSHLHPAAANLNPPHNPPPHKQPQPPVPRRGQQHHTATMALLQMKAPVDYQVQLSEY